MLRFGAGVLLTDKTVGSLNAYAVSCVYYAFIDRQHISAHLPAYRTSDTLHPSRHLPVPFL